MHSASTALCLLVALATTGEIASADNAATVAAPGKYTVEAKLISVPQATAKEVLDKVSNSYCSDDFIANLIQSPKARCLSFPKVEAPAHQPAVIAVDQKEPGLDENVFKTGNRLTVKPQTDGSNGDFRIAFARYEVFANSAGENPIHDVQSFSSPVTPPAAQSQGYRLFEVPEPKKPDLAYDANGRVMASVADANERQLLFVKITRG